MEDAERRWREEEEAGQDEHCDEQRASGSTSKLTPSRSSTSLKSILKKSILASDLGGTPQRTVTWSPSTLPAAPSPPEVDVTPEHPRSHARLAVKAPESSPLQHVYVADESLLGSDESREVEEALVSRTSISPTLSANASQNDSTESIQLRGSASKRGGAFLDRMQAFIPSPDSSIVVEPQVLVKGLPETSNILDTTEPSRLQEITVTDERSRMKASTGPRPLFLRHSVILEESSTAVSSASPPTSPSSPPQDFHSFANTTIATDLTPLKASVRSKANLRRPSSPIKTAAPVDEIGRINYNAGQESAPSSQSAAKVLVGCSPNLQHTKLTAC